MMTSTVCIAIDPDSLVDTLRHEAAEKLKQAEGELVLDFSSVVRIDTPAVKALEELADLAERASVKIVLRGTNVALYRALKLLDLTPKFTFVL